MKKSKAHKRSYQLATVIGYTVLALVGIAVYMMWGLTH